VEWLGKHIAILRISGKSCPGRRECYKTLMFSLILHTKLFRGAAKLALFAILLQVLLPLIHHPAQAAEAMPAGVHICSVLHHASDTTDADKTPVSKPSCPICFSLHLLGGGYVAPVADEIIVAFRDSHVVVAYDDAFAVRPFAWPGIGSRAPPAFA
jgi:hypothetical protein